MAVASAAERQVAVMTAPKSMPGRLAEHFAGKDGGLHDDDVGHGEKGGDPGHDFGADRGMVFVQFEKAFQHSAIKGNLMGKSHTMTIKH